MKTRYVVFFSLLMAAMVFMGSGCVKLQNKVLIKGTWELVNYRIDTSAHNFMETVLPSYNNPPGCCKYLIDFQDNDKVVGNYYVNDTLNYSIEGTWSLDEKSTLVIDLDKYVDGTFDIDRQNRKTYQLTSDKNKIELFPGSIIESPVTMDIKRRD